MGKLLRVHDPGLRSLRAAARATIVVPSVFAIGYVVFDDVVAGTFAGFGCFTALVFANFGGPPRLRALAYLASAVVGAGLIALGTALSNELIAVTAAFVTVFAIRLAVVFGGPVEKAGLPLTLAFVLAVTETGLAETGSRLAGWLGAGVFAAVASVALWPHYERARILRGAADACRALAAAARRAGTSPDLARAVGLFTRYGTDLPFRPAGPLQRDRALIRLMDELLQLSAYLPARTEAEHDERLASALSVTLEAAAARLDGGDEVPDLIALERARAAHREAVEARAAEAMRGGVSAEDLLERIDASFGLRVASYIVLSAAANAMIVTGTAVPPAEEFEIPPAAPETSGLRVALRAGSEQLRARLAPSSPGLRDAVRAATGISIAVLVALAAPLHHGFWVVLGTLGVLRSNAPGTGHTALQAILGTSIGFVIGSALILVIGTGSTALWIAMPITVFLAAYTPSAVHFIAGQAAFTVWVLVLYNLIQPIGWQVGLVRVENVTIGAGVSLVVGVLLWPRGGIETLRRSAASGYRSGAHYVADALGAVQGDDAAGRSKADHAAVLGAIDRSSDALRQHLGEPGRHLPLSTWSALLTGPRHLRAAGASLERIAQRYPAIDEAAKSPGFPDAAKRIVGRYESFANALESGSLDRSGARHRSSIDVGEVTRADVISALESWRSAPDAAHRDAALRLVWTRSWLEWLQAMAAELPDTITAVAATASVPWWRR